MSDQPNQEADPTEMLLRYECEVAAGLIAEAFQASGKKWFSLKEAVAWATGFTDIERLSLDRDPKDSVVNRTISRLLRHNHSLFISPRTWIGGQITTSVWISEWEKRMHFVHRKRLPRGTRNRGVYGQFDIDQQWRPDSATE